MFLNIENVFKQRLCSTYETRDDLCFAARNVWVTNTSFLFYLGWTIAVFAMNFILSWLLLGVVWYLIAYAHGDIEYFEQMDKTSNAEEFETKSNHTPCVTEIKTFLSAFLFSLETQHTIGKNDWHIKNDSVYASNEILLSKQLQILFQGYGHRFVTEVRLSIYVHCY